MATGATYHAQMQQMQELMIRAGIPEIERNKLVDIASQMATGHDLGRRVDLQAEFGNMLQPYFRNGRRELLWDVYKTATSLAQK